MLPRFLLLPFLALAGCVSPERAALNVGIAGITITDATLGETEAVFTLRIRNENVFPMVVEGGMHKIHLNGSFIGEAVSKETFAIPQLGTVLHSVSMHLGDGAAVERVRAIIAQGGAEYRIESRLTTNAYGNKTIVVNDSAGRFALPGR